MRTNIRRVLIVVAVVVWSLWAIYPPDDTIKLGLDLNGGAHLVLRVRTDDALRRETQNTAERLRDALTERRIAFTTLEASGSTGFRVEGITDAAAFRDLSAGLETTFEHAARDGTHTFRLEPSAASEIRRETVEQALHTIDRRVNELGVAEAVVARYTEADQILVAASGRGGRRAREADHQVDGAAAVDAGRARTVSQTATRRYRRTRSALPADLEILPGRSSPVDTGATRLLRRPEGAGGVRRRPARCAAVGRRAQSPGRGLHAEAGCRRRASASFTERHVNRAAGDRPRRPRHVGGDDSVAHRRSGTDHGTQPRRDDRAGDHLQVGRAAGGPGVRRGTHRSAPASARRRSAPACWRRPAV